MQQGALTFFGHTSSYGLHTPHEMNILSNLMINYIPSQVDEAYLRQLFEVYGVIDTIKIIYDKENSMSKGYGFVKYHDPQSASLAINNLNGYPILNKRLKVSYAKTEEAQRLLQHLHQIEQHHNQSSPIFHHPSTNATTLDANQVYYLQQLQAQQLWLQQMQHPMLENSLGRARPLTQGVGGNILSPQQQQMMLFMQQQANQAQNTNLQN